MGMNRLVAVAVVVVGVSVAAVAQHGGGGHGGGGGGFHGGGGGFASHGGGGGRVGGAPGGGFARPMNRGGGGGYAPRYGEQGRGFGGGQRAANGRPGFYHREGDHRREGRAYGVSGYGAGYGDYGWLDANDPGYDPGNDPGYDAGSADNGSYDVGPTQDGSGVAADGYAAQGPAGEDQGPSGEAPPVPYTAASAETGSGYEAPRVAARSVSVAQLSLYNSNAVTLVFKDGRAPETIHNYALTRTTLYVTDGRRREIPVAALDWAATEKVNRAAGVRFQLPVTP
jgi:hypothetical protein